MTREEANKIARKHYDPYVRKMVRKANSRKEQKKRAMIENGLIEWGKSLGYDGESIGEYIHKPMVPGRIIEFGEGNENGTDNS